MCDAVQESLLRFSEPKLATFSFHDNTETFFIELSGCGPATVAVVPHDYVGRVTAAFPEVPILAFGPPLFLQDSFRAGVRDYLKDPWDAPEFWARISRHLDPAFYELSWAQIRADGSRTIVDGIPLRVKPGAHRLMRCLLNSCGKVVQRKHLLQAIGMLNPLSRLVDVYVVDLRNALNEITGYDHDPKIVSHRGRGYSLVS
jgi:hypothetical protein